MTYNLYNTIHYSVSKEDNTIMEVSINLQCFTIILVNSEVRMKVHVSLINRSAYPQLKNLRAIKPFLNIEAGNTAAHAFVSSRPDAGNSILYGIAQGQLQCI